MLNRTTPFFIKALLSVCFYPALKYSRAKDKSTIEKEISYFSSKTFMMGTQKNQLNDIMLFVMDKSKTGGLVIVGYI